MKKKLKLVLPNREFLLSYLKMEKRLRKEGRNSDPERAFLESPQNAATFLERLKNERKGIELKKGRVPSTLYWAVVNGKVVGRLDVRHKLNKHLREIGGHIGYSVTPEERMKGYATEMLRLGLQKAKRMGIKKVLVTCDETNKGSKRVIEKNGGVLENKKKSKVYKLRFWIRT